MPMFEDLKVISGNAHPAIASDICAYLGIGVAECEVFKFSNDNTFVRIREKRQGKRRLRRAAHFGSGERPHHGAADHDRRGQEGLGRTHYCRDPLLRLREER